MICLLKVSTKRIYIILKYRVQKYDSERRYFFYKLPCRNIFNYYKLSTKTTIYDFADITCSAAFPKETACMHNTCIIKEQFVDLLTLDITFYDTDNLSHNILFTWVFPRKMSNESVLSSTTLYSNKSICKVIFAAFCLDKHTNNVCRVSG